ncbi:MbcA/ParS/Xre antitoxin family protein [uncultured Umboniibacter sp.]|uniref:MbcA/ParS/Xre antitoxin family protein n=1 Tax=uncultured Umboniibacter sp. TaxID=1798917 RepID=UPI002633DC7B|nr:MbcA/ParS/Xre antitoxin family protein [uncultured Umboniibacter sp.]
MSNVILARQRPTINPGKAFKLGNNILTKWGCSNTDKMAIMGLKKGTFFRYLKDESVVSLSGDQLERLSYLANIHQALRLVFSNPDNVYGFMSMENHNPFFNGRTPLSIISGGSFGALHDVYKRIDALRGGQW